MVALRWWLDQAQAALQRERRVGLRAPASRWHAVASVGQRVSRACDRPVGRGWEAWSLPNQGCGPEALSSVPVLCPDGRPRFLQCPGLTNPPRIDAS
eukprot:3315112-Rhodomonas_salina.1